ncbi:MAG: repeat protein, partial [Verrucomicrobiales bacterium]|nr:repeat protein [Verrucomicrobiales bacterium]
MNVKQLTRNGVFILSLISSLRLAPTLTAQTVYEDYTFVNLAGAGTAGAGWFDGFGNSARFNTPGAIARDGNGNLYVADSKNNTVRKITLDGRVTTLAGLSGVVGSGDGLGGTATFNSPFGVAVDGGGNVYVGDSANNTIRKISPGGVVTTLAGLAGAPG